MNTLKNRSGFTLLEILVVIIIVGVLASVAMPTLFKNVERSRATEALNTLGIMKRSMDGCSMQFNNQYNNCSTYNAIAMTDPGTNAGTHFTYLIVTAAGTSFTIRAVRNTSDNGVGGDQINLINTNDVITRSGTTNFLGIQ